jgi:hypothetical protein
MFLPSRTLFPTHTFPELTLNKITNGLVSEKLQTECLLIGSEQVCFSSAETAKKAVRDWTNRDHKITGSSYQDSKRQRDSDNDTLPEEPRDC